MKRFFLSSVFGSGLPDLTFRHFQCDCRLEPRECVVGMRWIVADPDAVMGESSQYAVAMDADGVKSPDYGLIVSVNLIPFVSLNFSWWWGR